jgi:DNA polymerase
MGVDKFLVTCENNGRSVDYEMGERAVNIFRKVRSKVVSFWYNCENAARRAIQEPGVWQRAGSKVKFAVTESEGIEYLVMMLPSKRRIVYPWPKLELSKRNGRKQITFFGNIKGNFWGRQSTYGGKLAENATQGIAADIMFNGSVKAEAKGFKILTLIHDEALSRGKGGDPHKELPVFVKALCDLPAWAEGLPIVAEGKVVPYYLK